MGPIKNENKELDLCSPAVVEKTNRISYAGYAHNHVYARGHNRMYRRHLSILRERVLESLTMGFDESGKELQTRPLSTATER